jgi:flagellar biosynthesis protein FlhA
MGGLIGFYAFILTRREGKAASFPEEAAKAKAKAAAASEEEFSPVVPLDPLSLELGYGLIPLVDKDKGAELVERIQRLRKEAGLELGLVIPKIRIIDNMRLESAEYCFKIKGMEVGRAKIRRGYYLCMNPGGITDELPGERTTDPTFGLPAVWISEDKREEAERAGYTVVDPPSIIATHIQQIIRRHASEILGRQETQKILDALRKDYEAVVAEAEKNASLGGIQKVLQGLLNEQVSIRNIPSILEAIADNAATTKDTGYLIEKARQSLGRQLCLQYADEDDRTIRYLTIAQPLEREIIESATEGAAGRFAALEPTRLKAFIRSVNSALSAVKSNGYLPLILCSEAARPLVKQLTAHVLPDLVVLSVAEIVQDVQFLAIGEIRVE